MSDSANASHTASPVSSRPRSPVAAVLRGLPVVGVLGLLLAGCSPSGMPSDQEELAIAQRIQRVGTIAFKEAKRGLQSGEEVYKAQCSACHAAGLVGAPKFGDAGAWAPRIATGYEALLNSALKGKGAMGPQGGGQFQDIEIARAMVYMTSAAGGKSQEPAAPAAEGGEGEQAAPAAPAM